MPLINSYATAQVLASQSSKVTSGKGIVEKTNKDGTVVIASGTARMTVQLTSGSLSDGDSVSFRFLGSDVLIAKIGTSALKEQSVHDDILDFFPRQNRNSMDDMLKNLAESIRNEPYSEYSGKLAGAVALLERKLPSADSETGNLLREFIRYSSKIISDQSAADGSYAGKCSEMLDKISSSMQANPVSSMSFTLPDADSDSEGFYYFKDISQALSWTKANGADINTENAGNMTKALGNSPVIIQVSCINNVVQCSLMTPDQAALTLQAFINNDITSSLSDELTPDILINVMFQRGFIPVNKITAMDSFFPAKGLESVLIGATDAVSLQSINQAATTAVRKPDAIIEQFINIVCDTEIQTDKLSALIPVAKPSVIPEMFENIIIKNPSIQTLNTSTFTINDTNIKNSAAENTIPSIFRGIGLDLESRLECSDSAQDSNWAAQALKPSLLSAINGNPAGSVATAMTPLQKTTSELIWQIRQLLTNITADGLKNTADNIISISKNLNTGIEEWTKAADNIVIQSIRHNNGLPNDEPGTGSQPASFNPETSSHLTDRIDTLTRAAVRQMFLQVESYLNNINCQALKLSAYTDKQAMSDDNNIDVILQTIKDSVAQAERNIRGIPWRIDRVVIEASRLAEMTTDTTAGSAKNSEALKNIEALLNKVESVQLLAKPVSTLQGEQQVVMLPMKIDGKWNDVMIKFLKYGKKSNSGRHAGNISVTIDVAPAFLGEINSVLEYSNGKDLRINMNFAAEHTRNWFESNRKEFTEAIEKNDFRSLQISMKMIRQKMQGNATGVNIPEKNDGIIDIVA
jgi:hypothetical protein